MTRLRLGLMALMSLALAPLTLPIRWAMAAFDTGTPRRHGLDLLDWRRDSFASPMPAHEKPPSTAMARAVAAMFLLMLRQYAALGLASLARCLAQIFTPTPRAFAGAS